MGMPETGSSGNPNNNSNRSNNVSNALHIAKEQTTTLLNESSSSRVVENDSSTAIQRQQPQRQQTTPEGDSSSQGLSTDDRSNPQTGGTEWQEKVPQEGNRLTRESVEGTTNPLQQQKQQSTTSTRVHPPQTPPNNNTTKRTSSTPTPTKVPPNIKDDRKIFVGGLPSDVTPEEFRQCFEKFGNVIESKIMYDRITTRSRGFGFITFDDPNISQRVIQLKRLPMRPDKIVEIKEAQPREMMNPITTTKANNNNYHHTSPRIANVGDGTMLAMSSGVPYIAPPPPLMNTTYYSDGSMTIDSSSYLVAMPYGPVSPNFVPPSELSPSMEFPYGNDPTVGTSQFYPAMSQQPPYTNTSEAIMFGPPMSPPHKNGMMIPYPVDEQNIPSSSVYYNGEVMTPYIVSQPTILHPFENNSSFHPDLESSSRPYNGMNHTVPTSYYENALLYPTPPPERTVHSSLIPPTNVNPNLDPTPPIRYGMCPPSLSSDNPTGTLYTGNNNDTRNHTMNVATTDVDPTELTNGSKNNIENE